MGMGSWYKLGKRFSIRAKLLESSQMNLFYKETGKKITTTMD